LPQGRVNLQRGVDGRDIIRILGGDGWTGSRKNKSLKGKSKREKVLKLIQGRRAVLNRRPEAEVLRLQDARALSYVVGSIFGKRLAREGFQLVAGRFISRLAKY
jgi:predicted RNA binding protein YcfA (HicA-like mRNA interferase family)